MQNRKPEEMNEEEMRENEEAAQDLMAAFEANISNIVTRTQQRMLDIERAYDQRQGPEGNQRRQQDRRVAEQLLQELFPAQNNNQRQGNNNRNNNGNNNDNNNPNQPLPPNRRPGQN